MGSNVIDNNNEDEHENLSSTSIIENENTTESSVGTGINKLIIK